jgi:hypothetical protein
MAKYYAWSDIRNGGKTEERKSPDGRLRTVVLERNVTPRGEAVTKAKLDVSDEEWDALIDGGSVRPYPVPEEANDFVSPTQAVIARLTKPGSGEVDQDMLLELALAHPPAAIPPAEEEAELPVGA